LVKHTSLILRKRRYRCSSCGKRFFEHNSFLPRYHRMTNRLAAYIISKLSDVRSFTSVAREVKSFGFNHNPDFLIVSTMESRSNYPKLYQLMSLKAIQNNEKYQCILTDPVRHRILDILPARYNHKLTEYFSRIDRSQTKYFCQRYVEYIC
jgi:transposase